MSTSTRLIAALAASTILLTGCGAGTTGESVPGAMPAPAAAPGWAAPDRGGVGGGSESKPMGDAAAGGGAVPYTTGVERQIARTASMTVVVDDVVAAGERVRALAATLEGWVTNESFSTTTSDGARYAPARSYVTLSVPASRLDDAVRQVGEIGTVRDRQTNAEDVTDVVVDLDARITSLQASVTRLQELVARSGSVADIAAVERELSTRQADLEAMKSQRLRLAGAVERSTLTVALLTPTQSTSTNPIQTGWSRGWSVFLESVAMLVTIVAALLPFALAVALVAVPLVLWLRRRRHSRASSREAVRPGEQQGPDEQPHGEDDPEDRPE